MFRTIALILVVIAGVTAFFVFHHPPMRLMPPPLLFHGEEAQVSERADELGIGNRLDLHYATTRLPIGPRHNRTYTVAPGYQLHFGQATLRIGDDSSTLDQLVEWTTGTGNSERPFVHLETMAEVATLDSGTEWKQSEGVRNWLAGIDEALGEGGNKDILIFVHGANTTVERAAGQASQLRHYSRHNSVVVLFVWPTAENFLRYSRDIRNAYGSAPFLAQLITLLAEGTRTGNINVFTYSAGATLGSDALALVARTRPEISDRLGEVYHAAPDADFSTFVDDLGYYTDHARRVTVAVNLGDSALLVSRIVNRASRAGRPDLRELRPEAAEWLFKASQNNGLEILNVNPDLMPELAATSHTFWYDDPWVSNDVLLTLLFNLRPDDRELDESVTDAGKRYWSFPENYPERANDLHDGLRARLQ